MLCEKQAQIRKLQQQLRNEEMALVLLKKIRQSQLLAEQVNTAKQSSATTNHNSSRNYQSQTQQNSRGFNSNSSQNAFYQRSQGVKQSTNNSTSKLASSGRDRDQYARQLAAAQHQLSGKSGSAADILKQVNLVSWTQVTSIWAKLVVNPTGIISKKPSSF